MIRGCITTFAGILLVSIASAEPIESIEPIIDKIEREGLAVIDKIAEGNDSDAVFTLLRIAGRRSAMEKARAQAFREAAKYALENVREIDNHAEFIGTKIWELSKLKGTYGKRVGLFGYLEALRTEEAVREVGELLFDDFSHPIQNFGDYSSSDGPNRYPAAGTLMIWLRDLDGVPSDVITSAARPPHTVLREWWTARRDDPDSIRAIVEQLPMPPLKSEASSAPSDPDANSQPKPKPKPTPQSNRQPSGEEESNNFASFLIGVVLATAAQVGLLMLQRTSR